MADARWMDADCIHGVAWFECQRCDTLHQARQLAAKAEHAPSLREAASAHAQLLDLLAQPVPDTGTEPEPEPTFVFYGTFDALAANRGWYDHRCYRWVVYSLDEPVPDTGAEPPPHETRTDRFGMFTTEVPPVPDTGAEP